MVELQCPLCDFKTPELEVIGAAAVLNAHALSHPRPPAAPLANRAPKLERPKVKSNISSEEWNAFFRRWKAYKTGFNIADNVRVAVATVPGQKKLG